MRVQASSCACASQDNTCVSFTPLVHARCVAKDKLFAAYVVPKHVPIWKTSPLSTSLVRSAESCSSCANAFGSEKKQTHREIHHRFIRLREPITHTNNTPTRIHRVQAMARWPQQNRRPVSCCNHFALAGLFSETGNWCHRPRLAGAWR